jgi:hypothetical protein
MTSRAMSFFSLKKISMLYKKILLCFLLLGVLAVAYIASASFSEHREYKSYSLDYWILAPDSIRELARLCKSDPHFIYSSADGAKPTTTSLNCTLVDDSLDYLMRSNFAKVSDSAFKKDNQEFEIIRSEQGDIVTVTLLEFL